MQTGIRLQTLHGQSGPISDVAFSRNGTLASGSWDSTVRLWNPKTGAVLHKLRASGGTVKTVAFNSDGSAVAAGNLNRTVDIWNPRSGRHLMTLRGHTKSVASIAFSPDDSKRASAGEDGTVRIWDTETGQQEGTITAHPEWPMSLAFSPDGSSIATGHLDRSVRLWDPRTGRILNRLTGLSGFANSVDFNVDGTKIAAAGYDEIRLWHPKTGKILHTLTGPLGNVRTVAFSPDGSMIASGSGFRDNSVRLWDTNTGELLHTLAWHTREIMSVAFSSDSGTLAGASKDGTVSLWHTKTGFHLWSLTGHTHEVVGVAFSRDGRKMASASTREAILWDAETWEPIHALEGNYNEACVPAFSPDSRTLAWGSTNTTVRLWDVDTGEMLRSMPGHAGGVSGVAFSPGGTSLASASWDGTVLVWELTPMPTVDTVVSISPSLVPSPQSGERFTLALNISGGVNVAGYQATIFSDDKALRFVDSHPGIFLGAGSFAPNPVVNGRNATIGGAAIGKTTQGDGTLAYLTFEVVEPRLSFVSLVDVGLSDPNGELSHPHLVHARVIEQPPLGGDVNGDGVVNILDLVQVAGAIGGAGAAPSAYSLDLSIISAADVAGWLAQAQGLGVGDANFERGIHFLKLLLAALTPEETALLQNYPNPFNPETWIPYRLAQGAEVNIAIYDAKGTPVRRLALGYQAAGEYAASRRMVIIK